MGIWTGTTAAALKRQAERRAAAVQRLREELVAGGEEPHWIKVACRMAAYASDARLRHAYLLHGADGKTKFLGWVDHPVDRIWVGQRGRLERLDMALRRLGAQEE